MSQQKKIVIGSVAALILILILQNFESVAFSFFFWTFELPRAVLLLVALVLGGTLGYGIAKRNLY
jgi:uncharacterized integral membrane protein